MKLIQTILFGVFLISLLQVQAHAGSRHSIGDFFTSQWKELLIRLETWLDACPDEKLLPFTLTDTVIQDLRRTSNEFTDYFVKTEIDLSKTKGAYAPVAALKKTIDVIFESIDKRTKENHQKLNIIKQVDPIGFDAYITEIHEQTDGTYEMDDLVEKYHELTEYRSILFNCKQHPSRLNNLEYNGDKLSSVPEWIRREVATENSPLSDITMNYFLDIVAKQYAESKIYQVRNSEPHTSGSIDGLRILQGGKIGPNKVPNWICIKYESYTKRLHIYNNIPSSAHQKKEIISIEDNIIRKLFPLENLSIIYEKSKYARADPESSGIWAICYATTVMNGEDPTKIKFDMNQIHGDKSLFMRLHLMKILANRELTAFL